MPPKIPLPGGLFLTSIDPYLTVVVDDDYFGETNALNKTFSPVWKERIEAFVRKARDLEFSVFHKTSLGDRFIASTKISISDLVCADSNDLRVQTALACVVVLVVLLSMWALFLHDAVG